MASYEQLTKAFANAKRVAESGGANSAVAAEKAKQFASMLKNQQYDIDESLLGREGTLAAMLQGIGQGATFGFADEMGAGLRTGIDKLLLGDDRDWSKTYEANLASQRGALDAARRVNPKTTMASEFAGGLGSGGLAFSRMMAGRGLLGAMTRGAATGGIYGAVGGYGNSKYDPIAAMLSDKASPDTVKNELYGAVGNTAAGATMGALMGGTLPSLLAGARATGRFALTAMPGTRNWMRKGKLREAGRQVVAKSFMDDVAAGEVSYDGAIKALKDVPGMTVADLGPALRSTAETVMHSGTQAGTELRRFAETRNRSAWQRFLPRLAAAMGREKDNFTEAKKALFNEAKEGADEFYTKAFSKDIEITPRMRQLVQSPEFRNVQRDATRFRQARLMKEGVPVESVPDIDLANAKYMPTQDVDYIIRAMSGKVDDLFRSKKSAKRSLGLDYKNMRKEFMDDVFAQNDDLREARNMWVDNKSVDEAIEYGEKILRDDVQNVAEKLAGMSDGEKLGVRIGTLHAVSKAVLNKADDADIIKGVFNSEGKRRIIREAFGDEDKFRDFMDFVRQQQDQFDLYKRSLGSDTARRLMAGTAADEQIAALSGYAFGMTFGGALPPSIAGNLVKRGYQGAKGALGYGQGNVGQFMQNQANFLRSTDIDQLLKPNMMGGLLQTGAPRIGSEAVGGLLATGIPQQVNDVHYGGP